MVPARFEWSSRTLVEVRSHEANGRSYCTNAPGVAVVRLKRATS
jgi:hypothetical protein